MQTYKKKFEEEQTKLNEVERKADTLEIEKKSLEKQNDIQRKQLLDKINQQTSSSADPTTTEYANDKDWGIHENTTSGNIYLAFNNGGTIVKTQLS